MVGCIEVDKQVHIALAVESIRQDGAKDSQSLDLMLPAKVDNSLQIQFNQLHIPLCYKRKDTDSFRYINATAPKIVAPYVGSVN